MSEKLNWHQVNNDLRHQVFNSPSVGLIISMLVPSVEDNRPTVPLMIYSRCFRQRRPPSHCREQRRLKGEREHDRQRTRNKTLFKRVFHRFSSAVKDSWWKNWCSRTRYCGFYSMHSFSLLKPGAYTTHNAIQQFSQTPGCVMPASACSGDQSSSSFTAFTSAGFISLSYYYFLFLLTGNMNIITARI